MKSYRGLFFRIVAALVLAAGLARAQSVSTWTTFWYQMFWYGPDGKLLTKITQIGEPGTYEVRGGAAVLVTCSECRKRGAAGYRVTVTYTISDGTLGTMMKLISMNSATDTSGDYFLYGPGDVKRIVTEVLWPVETEDVKY